MLNNIQLKFGVVVLGCSFGFIFERISNISVLSKMDCELSIVDIDGLPLRLLKKENVDISENLFHWLDVNEDIFGSSKSKFLPRDTLTVLCRMRKCTSRGKQILQPEVLSFCTRIERSSFVWNIENVCHLQPLQKNKIHFLQPHLKTPIFTFEFFFDKKERLEINLNRSECCPHIDASFKLSMLDSTRKVFHSHNFSSFNPCSRFALKKRQLIDNESLYLLMGMLSLQIDCFFFFRENVKKEENVQEFLYQDLYVISDRPITDTNTSDIYIAGQSRESTIPVIEKNKPSSQFEYFQSMQSLYEEGLFSDLYLLCEGSIFQAHKSILSARSSVFRAMLTTDMQEKESDCVDISDVESETLNRLLLFVYSNQLEEDLQWEGAANLYFAADKYAIEDLKQASCSVLKSKLCASNACEIFVLSDLHRDQELKSTVMDFILSHDSEVIGKEMWKEFQKSHCHLAIEILMSCMKRNCS